MFFSANRTINAIFAILFCAALGFTIPMSASAYQIITSPLESAPVWPQRLEMITAAKSACDRITADASANVSLCTVWEANPSIDLVITGVSPVAAKDACLRISRTLAAKFPVISGNVWQVRIQQSPLAGQSAACRL